MVDEKPKSRRPDNTAFKQQRLKAWQPLLTPKSVLPALFVLGIIFAPLGAFLLHTSSSVSELIIDYTQCSSAPTAFSPANPSVSSFAAPGVSNPDLNLQWRYNRAAQTNSCTLQFNLPSTFVAPVFMYYRLTNFYQNHRRYVRSFDAAQLRGNVVPPATIQSNCGPLGQVPNQAPDVVYYPCGLIADSMFNDTIGNPINTNNNAPYTFSDKGIAWPADRLRYGRLDSFDPNKHIPPPNWVKRFGERYTQAPDIDTNERFWVWQRTAGLPNFRKLYGRNDANNLEQGVYSIVIEDNFEVLSFGGSKSIVISTVSFMGGKNPFLGYAYIVVGSICILIAVIFAARHLYSPRKLGDHTYLSWNHQPPPSTSQ